MTTSVGELMKMGDRLFSKRGNLLNFWQTISENFNPVGADYTSMQTLGTEYGADLMTSYPLLLSRELTDMFSSMLRPADKIWARQSAKGVKDYDGKRWLQWATGVQREAMYDRNAQFVSATKAGDRDFGNLGQCVISVEMMPDGSSLLYRQWHLRDVAWSDSLSGAVECVHRKWNTPTAYELARTFGLNKLSKRVQDALEPGKDPYCEVQCRHIVIPTDMYHGETKFRTPLVSIYLDVDSEHIIEVRGSRLNSYVIPRWQRINGTPYAVSPATVCGLPEARLLQSMVFTLLEAGEKAVNPPMVAAFEAFRKDVDMRAGGITYYSADYDERGGEVIRPLSQDKSGLPFGLEQQSRSELLLRQIFYLDKLNMPTRAPEMTAYEVSQRVQEYIRNALPLFEPVETDYNGGLCERTFEVLAENGAFGPQDTWPDSVRRADIEFKFVSPLRDEIEKQKADIFMQANTIVSTAVALDPGSALVLDAADALRDTLYAIGVPVSWTRKPEVVEEIKAQQAEQAEQQQLLASMTQAATIAKDFSAAQAQGGGV